MKENMKIENLLSMISKDYDFIKIENTIVPIILQQWIPKYNDFTPDEERTTYYLPVDVINNIINTL